MSKFKKGQLVRLRYNLCANGSTAQEGSYGIIAKVFKPLPGCMPKYNVLAGKHVYCGVLHIDIEPLSQ